MDPDSPSQHQSSANMPPPSGDPASSLHNLVQTDRENGQEHAPPLQAIDAQTLATRLTDAVVEVTGFAHLEQVNTAILLSSTHYELLAKVGEGGMGEILLARDHLLRRPVAYKKLHPQFAQNETILGQFFDEVQITSQLEHPNVVPIYNLEVDQHDSIAYSMKLVQGKSFKELIHEAQGFYQNDLPVPDSHSLPRFLEYFLKVCSAMEYAHKKGVIHRDLKPANIMIGAYNEVYVLDWGVAALIGQIEKGVVLGTPRYMSPEQAGGLNSSLDQQSDVFSLGLILFEVVTLTQAIPKAKDTASVMSSIIKGQRNPIVHFRPTVKVPVELAAMIDKATQRRRKDRYGSVKEMAHDLRRYLRGEAVLARPDTPMQKLKRWISQNREKASALILGIFLTLFCLIGLSLYFQNKSTLALQNRQEHLQTALVRVTEKTQQLNEQLIDIEILVARLSTFTAHLLDYGPAINQPFYTLEDYQQPSTEPPGMVFSAAYRQRINPDQNVFLLADKNQQSRLASLIHRLSPLTSRLRQTLLDSAGNQTKQRSPHELNALVVNQVLPFSSVYIGFDDGLTVAFPGQAGYASPSDPRQTPWYTLAKQTGKGTWQQPYRSDKGISNIPYTMPIYDRYQQFRGVAAVDIPTAYMQKQFLKLDVKGVLETSLVTKKGEILYDSKDLDPASKTKSNLRQPENPRLVKALQEQTENYYAEDGILYIYCYLPAQDWFYLVKADEQVFLASL